MKAILLILMIIPLRAFCPPAEPNRDKSPPVESVNPYQAIWQAICFVESSNNPDTVNMKEQAYGIVQIRQVRLNDYLKRSGKRCILTEMKDTVKAKEVFMYYAKLHKDPEKIARNWNGGPHGMKKKSTVKYWNKVKRNLPK